MPYRTDGEHRMEIIMKRKKKKIIPVVIKRKPFLLWLQDTLEHKLQDFFEPKRLFLLRKAWPLWAKTLGCKISKDDREADVGALIRTSWVLLHVVTCIAIVCNTIRHW